ncbi:MULTISPECIES: hypothetical protein [Cyanophyceae]|uniref:hypothetical protein n=1 Tax=Cyanophyceae TaxID=3028117 RepID=UPI00016DC98B|nr:MULTISPECIES: hypothetical protein [Cyanophyceae]ACA99875.1 hypothetical protein SYNPCC7002_A1887 [Picosynechococcus sp. PCC 7002]SMH55106.1 hypothetical protein SAMN06272755_2903 [Picosynechococcus sp. OG1]SMQ83139.1 hypothetical protein SAMN06272774_2179 [Synechococcus sp. 7002]
MDNGYFSPEPLEANEFKALMLRHGVTKTDLVKSGWFEEYEIANCIERRKAQNPSRALKRLFGLYAHFHGWGA